MISGQQAAARLRQMILDGTLAPGETLRQEELARRLDISRTPLREALAILGAEGLVQVNPRRSVTVFKPSIEELKELFEVRTVLESAAVERAAPHFPPEDLRQLGMLIEQMEAAPTGTAFNRLNQQFHDACYLPNGLPRLLSLLGQIRSQATPYTEMMLTTPEHRKQAQEQHRELLIALRDRDAERAVRIIRAHLQLTINTIVAELSERTTSSFPG